MTWLKLIVALGIAASCLIAYLGLTEEYDARLARAPAEGRVVEVRGDVVVFEVHVPDQGRWAGPYRDEDMPEDARERLRPGDPLVIRGSRPEQSIHRPTPLLLLGVLLGLALAAWAIVAPIRARRAIEQAASSPLALLELAVRTTWRKKLTAAALLSGMGALLAIFPFFLDDALWVQLFLAAFGLASVLLGALVLLRARELRDPKGAPVLRAIRETPERLVWLYEHVVTVNGIATNALIVCRDDGRRFELFAGDLAPDALVGALTHLLPHAIVGYSPERDEAFARAPTDFARAFAARSAA